MRSFNSIAVSALLAGSLFLSGCATIVSSRQKPTAIDSSPSKLAYKIVDGNGAVVSEGRTPTTVTLQRSSAYFKPGTYTIQISQRGKVVGTQTVSAGINGWYFGNILLGGLIGMVIVDPLSGAMYRMPESITVATNQTSVALGDQPKALQIVDISTLTSAQRSKLVRI
ncbi:hypothetical protein JIN84_11930 [Luteolibacter yonseiensis]|uniref:Lipoprotein n=1 Tax=Luteolibacter yonseiensis TaxID=1144680 RepID=A0A934R6W6_9BACT|nr:hypothetical protein [Luteolibacter yonseiensis]MBK1816325.1 hypothetical protein [Luteolibacter yonseiensis]